jgi:hypothetical protein
MSPMTRNAFVFGGLMIALAVGFYIPTAQKTALIPAAFGILLVIAGIIAMRGEHARKHAMHVAATVSLLGVLSVGMPISKLIKGTFSPLAVTEQFIFSALSLVFMILCIKSFRDARRARPADYQAK